MRGWFACGEVSRLREVAGVRHRLRSMVWRELPYSARRTIVGVLRAIDDFEQFWVNLWRSLYYSPAWIFVACVGSLGIGLTILLFFLITQELLGNNTKSPLAQPIIEPAALAVAPDQLDTRLCLDDRPLRPLPYPAEFGFDYGVIYTRHTVPADVNIPPDPPPTRRPPSRGAPRVEEPVWPVAETSPAPVENRGLPLDDADLEFDVRSWRHPVAPDLGKGPPRELQARSEAAPVDLARLADQLRSGDLALWNWFRERPPVDRDPVAYQGHPHIQMEEPDERHWDDFTAWPNRADVGLQVELYAPHRSTPHQTGRSRLLVRNTSAEPIRRIEIQEPIRWLDRVTEANPPAALVEQTLYRELHRLGGGREKLLELEWFPTSAGDRHHEARVIAEVFVAASVDVTAPEVPPPTEPVRAEPVIRPELPPVRVIEPEPLPRAPVIRTPVIEVDEVPEDFGPPPAAQRPAVERPVPPPSVQPAIACRVSGQDRVQVEGVAELSIVVANTGNTPLSGVRIWADLPSNLRHRYGDRLELAVGELSPGQQHEAVLRVVGSQVGLSRARIQAVSMETTSPDANAVLAVIPEPAAPAAQPRRLPVRPACPCPCGPQVSFRGI